MNAGVLITVAFVVIVVVVRLVDHSRPSLDPRRAFTQAQRAQGFARAGNRCEHLSVFGRRCSAAPTHGDHHYPHSRGGATELSNFVALCARHNLVKGARIPSRFSTRRLERRRKAYFPSGSRTDLVWQQGRR